MKVRVLVLLMFFTFPVLSAIAQTNKSEVIIISTIHGAHEVNPHYTYDSLFEFIEKYNPDLIGVEIREEDIYRPASYLKNNYPYEMYACITRHDSKKVVGFDWLGNDIAGKAIPENYWKEKSQIINLQQKLAGDSIIQQKLAVTHIIQEEKKKIALNASLEELNDGRYDLINHIYYEQLNLLLKNTAYKPLSDFYVKRDAMIAETILDIIKSNKGKKMIFLIGTDHRSYTLKKVTEELDGTIILNHY